MFLKIERISENKIKCTLDREDLASHNLVLTEFAYGSEKAREFFRDLMLQAEDEVGFEAEDIPLMIEAIPVSKDSVVLFVTKVSEPEELDTRFSRFTSDPDDEYDDDEDGIYDRVIENEIEVDSENASDLLDVVKDAVKTAMEGLSRAVEAGSVAEDDGFVPLNQSARKISPNGEKKPVEKVKSHNAIYEFMKLDDVCIVSKHLAGLYRGDNTLYKDMVGGNYYLVLSSGNMSPDGFTKVCNLLSEYGVRKRNSYALEAYFEEHYMCVIRSNAIHTLSGLSR